MGGRSVGSEDGIGGVGSGVGRVEECRIYRRGECRIVCMVFEQGRVEEEEKEKVYEDEESAK
ncbi:predicted protein [Sclerotinia sclerotiorum 1980 UF-70]|uniref:Uncharacterized protein n=1 Tax=Sclerotinia sclerotiorum (strain ATCC 18683 / 1980 / Ss-1) TaxID=665079 RepID=A7EZP3_SCLS1|nr:predicted protein [Sclerotinia sclerotiorum 1980 UF-70]EDN94935.1 predicted protein [Sclerotinia sclerotiorum 1980 UF-70]